MWDWYSAWLPDVRHRSDFNHLLDMLSGEIAVGHSYVSGGDYPNLDNPRTGLLGADLREEDGNEGALRRWLVEETEARGIWTLQAGIFPENEASIRIFEKAGFRILGTHERLGRFHDGRWRDVVLLERRSRVAGVD